MSQRDMHIQRLVRGALSSHLLLFRWWLMYSNGELRDGVWRPLPDLTPVQCEEMIQGLSRSQLADLGWRGMIPHSDQDDRPPAFFLRVSPLANHVEVSDLAVIIHDPFYEQTLYDLPEEQALLRLRYGDLEHLKAARYPGDIPSLMAALAFRIAPASFPRQPRTAHQPVRDLSAILHANQPDAATFARLRELLLPPTADDTSLDRMVLAEREVIAAALDAVRAGWADHRLAQTVAALIEARNT